MRFFVCMLLFAGFLFCADVSIATSDFVERVINFLIFFAIVWYLGAEKIKEIFIQRRTKISQSFDDLQEQEKQIRKQRQEAENLIIEAKNKASEIVSSAKKEAFLIAQNLDSRLKEDVKHISDSFDVVLEQEKRKLLRQEINLALDKSLTSLSVSNDAYMKILERGIKNG